MKKTIILFTMFFLIIVNLGAQVVTRPRVFSTPAFPADFGLFPGTEAWASFRHVLNQEEVPYFGHDWLCGVNIGIVSGSGLAVYGLAEETFHFTAAPESQSRWIFNPGSIISDLRLILFLNLEPLVVEAGFQHDCKHEVDRTSIRLQIHDLVYMILRPSEELTLLSNDFFSVDADFAAEGGYNLPAVFQEAPQQPDLGHLSAYFGVTAGAVSVPWFAITVDGSVSATWRAEDSPVEGLAPVGIDYNIRGGPAFTGERGKAVIYLGLEHLTDDWSDFNQQPADIAYFSIELTAYTN